MNRTEHIEAVLAGMPLVAPHVFRRVYTSGEL